MSGHQGHDGRDYFGREIKPGQTVAQAYNLGRSAAIKVRKVFRVNPNGSVSLEPGPDDWSKQRSTVLFSGRLVILSEAGVEYPVV